jgi:hypothetical protein
MHPLQVEAVPAITTGTRPERRPVLCPESSIESCSPGTVTTCPVRNPANVCLTWSN